MATARTAPGRPRRPRSARLPGGELVDRYLAARPAPRPPRRRLRRRLLRPAGAGRPGRRPSRWSRPRPLRGRRRATSSPTSTTARRAPTARRRPPPVAAGPGASACTPVAAQARPARRSPTPTRSRPATACGPRPVPEDELAAAHRAPRRGAARRRARSRERYIGLARGPGRAAREARRRPSRRWPRTSGRAPQRAVRPARRRAHRLRARHRPAVVGLQLLPRRPAQPGRHQHRPAGAQHVARPPRRPRGLPRPPHRAHPQGGRPGAPAAASSRRRSSSSARPQCLLAEGLADLGLEVLVGERPEPVVAEHLAPARHPLRRRGRRRGRRRPARRSPRCGATSPGCSTRTARPVDDVRRLRRALGACCPRTGPRRRSSSSPTRPGGPTSPATSRACPLCRALRRRRPRPLRAPPHRAAHPRRPRRLTA